MVGYLYFSYVQLVQKLFPALPPHLPQEHAEIYCLIMIGGKCSLQVIHKVIYCKILSKKVGLLSPKALS